MTDSALWPLAALPVVDLDVILQGGNPLVLAPHPDDESLGCGGLLAACVAAEGRPAVLILTDGVGSHPNSRSHPPDRLRSLREEEARNAARELVVAPERLAFLGLPDTAAPHPADGSAFTDTVDAIVAAMGAWDCHVLLAPWRHDPHGDHYAAHLMATEAARRCHAIHRAYPIWGLTLPDVPSAVGWQLDISAQLPRKRRAIAAHRSQYAGVIDDDPTGFQMEPRFMALFDTQYEYFLDPAS